MKIWSQPKRKNRAENGLIHRMARVKMGRLLLPILVSVASGKFFFMVHSPILAIFSILVENLKIRPWHFEALAVPLKEKWAKSVVVTLNWWWIWNSTWVSNLLGEECWNGPTSRYDGTKSTTKSGLTCQDWSLDKPHVPKHRPKDIDMATGKSHNHCRLVFRPRPIRKSSRQ